MKVTKRYKKRLNALRRAARIKRRADAPSAELAMLNFEQGKMLPISCSNPDRLQEYVFGLAMLQDSDGPVL